MGRPNTMGLSRRDVERIKRLAEQVTDYSVPPALADLDAPWRICALKVGDNPGNGTVFGEWAGRLLVAWYRPRPGLSQAEYQTGQEAAMAALRASYVSTPAVPLR
jgi:hypothetical protein